MAFGLCRNAVGGDSGIPANRIPSAEEARWISTSVRLAVGTSFEVLQYR